MRRRAFIGGAASAAIWPVAARAQQADRIHRIGVLMSITADDPEAERRVAALRTGLSELGWRDGVNLRLEFRWAGGDTARMAVYARELAQARPDAMLTFGGPGLMAVREAAPGISTVFVAVVDPIGNGYVTNLAHPGGSITGFANVEFGMVGKWLELLKEVAPRTARVAVCFDPRLPSAVGELKATEDAAASLSVNVVRVPATDPSLVDSALVAAAREADTGLLVLPSPFTTAHRDVILGVAARQRIPAVYPYRYFPVSGGLMSYGIDLAAQLNQAASYIDRILRGEKPGDLPVQQASKFELVINLKTAKSLGLAIPLPLLGRADEVIE